MASLPMASRQPRRWSVAATLALLVGALCASEAGADSKKREVQEKTPTPCKSEYTSEEINSYAEAHLEGTTCGHEAPHMLLLLGGSAAGKGTYLKRLQAAGFPMDDFIMHGIDDYLEYLPEFKQSAAHPEQVFKDAADGCYGGAIPVAKAAQRRLLENKCHVIYEETGKNLKRVVERVVPPFTDAGYRITLAFIDADPDIAKARAVHRFHRSGRYSSDEYIEGTFLGVFENYLKLREMPFAAESIYCDNGCHSAGNSKSEWDCMRCWDDTVGAGGPSEGALTPRSALEVGAPVRMARPLHPPPSQEL